MKKIKINLNLNRYEVKIGSGNISGYLTRLTESKLNKNIFSVIDKSVLKLHQNKLLPILSNQNVRTAFVEFKAGEDLKTFESLQHIFVKMLDSNLGRDAIVLAIGGGIIGDVTGFAASTYMRGIKYVQIPTTLLAAVDSSVGGKTGINFKETKNVIGSFHQPQAVVIDTDFYHTLPESELICGMGEVVKYAFISDEKFYKYFEKNFQKILSFDNTVLSNIIYESVRLKADVVMNDEKETGLRKMLNLGHTFAHAFEVEQEHGIKHGQAVVVGIACSLFLSNKLGLLSSSRFDKFLTLIHKFTPYIKIHKVDKDRIKSIMTRDKKASNGEIKFVLLKDIGKIVIDVSAPANDIDFAIEKGTSLFM